MPDLVDIAGETERARTEMESARNSVREAANEIASIADVVEPALHDLAKRIRSVRMSTIDEIRQVVSGIVEMRRALVSAETKVAVENAERLIRVWKELDSIQSQGGMTIRIDRTNV